jgi:hypothetical protein
MTTTTTVTLAPPATGLIAKNSCRPTQFLVEFKDGARQWIPLTVAVERWPLYVANFQGFETKLKRGKPWQTSVIASSIDSLLGKPILLIQFSNLTRKWLPYFSIDRHLLDSFLRGQGTDSLVVSLAARLPPPPPPPVIPEALSTPASPEISEEDPWIIPQWPLAPVDRFGKLVSLEEIPWGDHFDAESWRHLHDDDDWPMVI